MVSNTTRKVAIRLVFIGVSNAVHYVENKLRFKSTVDWNINKYYIFTDLLIAVSNW